MAIAYPLWTPLKTNIVTELKSIAAEEALVDPGRNFVVEKDRWRPWIEVQQTIPLVNVMVRTVGIDPDRSAARRQSLDEITVIVDMYALGKAGDVLPSDELAAQRLDLLVAQVREGLTRLNTFDFGFNIDDPTWGPIIEENGNIIDRNLDFTLTYYDQENEQTTGQYAPARWSFPVKMPFIPNDKRVYNNLEELNVDLQQFAVRFNYTP